MKEKTMIKTKDFEKTLKIIRGGGLYQPCQNKQKR